MQRRQIERKAAERYRTSRFMGLVHVPKASSRNAIRMQQDVDAIVRCGVLAHREYAIVPFANFLNSDAYD